MAPNGMKRKLSMQEQAAAWQQKALIMNSRASTARPLATLEARPDILPAIMEHLDMPGVKAPGHQPEDAPTTPPAKPSWSQRGAPSSGTGSCGSSDAVSEAEAGSLASMSDLDLEETRSPGSTPPSRRSRRAT